MPVRSAIRTLLAAVPGVLAAAAPGLAQQPGASSAASYQAQQSLSVAAYQAASNMPGTPFLNPYTMTMGQANPDYLTYLYLQNQQSGGIGSGVISGTRVAPGVPAGSTVPARTQANGAVGTNSRGAYPARLPANLNRVTLPIDAGGPAENTGAHFMRGPRSNQNAARYFNRTTPAKSNGR